MVGWQQNIPAQDTHAWRVRDWIQREHWNEFHSHSNGTKRKHFFSEAFNQCVAHRVRIKCCAMCGFCMLLSHAILCLGTTYYARSATGARKLHQSHCYQPPSDALAFSLPFWRTQFRSNPSRKFMWHQQQCRGMALLPPLRLSLYFCYTCLTSDVISRSFPTRTCKRCIHHTIITFLMV